MLVDQGHMQLDEPLPFEWLPRARGEDPRRAITLRHVLNMSSGLELVDNAGMEYATGSGMAYWAGTSSVAGARSQGLIREPGTNWDYDFTPDAFYGSQPKWVNSGDKVILKNASGVIDATPTYTGNIKAASFQLDASVLDATANDDVSKWCKGTADIGSSGDKGTPGDKNSGC